MKKLLLFIVLSILLFLFLNCEQKLIEKGYVIVNDDEEIYNGPVFTPDVRDGNYTLLLNTVELSSPRVFNEPTTVIVGKDDDAVVYQPAYNGYDRQRTFYYLGRNFTGTAYRADFYDRCYCGHLDYYIVYYRIPDYVYISPEPTAWDHDEGYIAPKILKYNSGGSAIYRMWYTKCSRHYDNSYAGRQTGYKKFDYVYETKCAVSNDGINWDSNVDSRYYESFVPNSAKDDRGGIIISDIIRESDSFYTAYYIAKNIVSGEHKGWKMYSTYSLNTEPTYWERDNMYLTINTSSQSGFDTDSIGTGNVIKDNNIYKMWYAGIASNKARIGYVTSEDSISYWNKYSSEPIYKGKRGKFDQLSVNDPFVLKDNGLYKMFYSGYNGTRYQLGVAYSYDGIEFGYYDIKNYNPINLGTDMNDVRYPYVLIDEDNSGRKIYRLYYCRKDNNGVWRIHTAVTSSSME